MSDETAAKSTMIQFRRTLLQQQMQRIWPAVACLASEAVAELVGRRQQIELQVRRRSVNLEFGFKNVFKFINVVKVFTAICF